jgi:hypothetical protein
VAAAQCRRVTLEIAIADPMERAIVWAGDDHAIGSSRRD